ncbi:3-hydroxyacyl-ACP dehydratase [Desulfonema ishimotonii]|uniref:3-hydroxyacyl-ACP dehydratase n=1 Tax=Desulfonema ishimotonii TaxID=45657 RepID=A0A401FUE8_9BACT|nr:acyl-CoA dehydratase activase [Desulfonema ishimotonii]GBC60574.1 3-hydroxyacyl-ACP dehydratase [Desulfonema ishimotonii]
MIAGIDIGSRSVELVVTDGEKIIRQAKAATTFDPLSQVKKLLGELRPERIVGTGYGRNLLADADLGTEVTTITEIKAYALGTHRLFPAARTVLDIGGQDTKAISLTNTGKVARFEMNDRCAAGTGKFLEHVASVFQIPVETFGDYALEGDEVLSINSMCTVFAETEATSLMAQGQRPQNIALGLHASVVRRTANMLRRVGLEFPLVFAGGVARNRCVIRLMQDALSGEPLIPEEPDMVGAYGAALHGSRL